MNKNLAWEIVGGLSSPSKMPCYGYSIPARYCITGQKLRAVENSICSKCYALKGRYVFKNVQTALEKRFVALNHPKWVEAMIFLLNTMEKSGFFRWHDSGDIQSVEHLSRICAIAEHTPQVKHWLPTREFSIVAEYVNAGNSIPENLCVRLSALMFDGPAPVTIANRFGLQVSGASKDSFTCPASNQGNKCGTCRSCWSKEVFSISYKKH
jgi:hypothetical protein